MKRNLVRFQLLLLLIAVGLVGYRLLDGPGAPQGAAVLHNISLDHLSWTAITVDRPVQVAVEAVGSYRLPNRGGLEAFGWILDRSTREAVWKMDETNARRERGTLAVSHDTITLTPGTYDVFFTPFGSATGGKRSDSAIERAFNPEEHWQNDRRKWKLVLRSLDDAGAVRRTDTDEEAAAPRPDNLVWTTAPQEPGDKAEALLEVVAPARLAVYAVGTQLSPERIRIERLTSGETVWGLPSDQARPAAGLGENSQYRGVVSLQPGLYRIYAEAAPRHGWKRWRGNPPLDPLAWGVTVAAERPGTARLFDPWRDRAPAASLLQMRDNVDRYVRFRVTRPMGAFISALGEMSGEYSRYDYGWLTDDAGATVWEMTYDASERAGGARKNRIAETFLQLQPGVYKLHYRSDGSHSYGNFNETEPRNPERWGIALFALTEAGEQAPIQVLETSAEELQPSRVDAEGGEESAVPSPPEEDESLVSIRRVGNDQQFARTFTLQKPGVVRVYAIGEVTDGEQYDYAWITNESGERVWEMSAENTVGAGGTGRNRLFDGEVALSEGAFTVHYQSDGSHAFGNFSDDPPRYPEWWGVTVVRLR